jgi:hypothetical protein
MYSDTQVGFVGAGPTVGRDDGVHQNDATRNFVALGYRLRIVKIRNLTL